LLIALALLLTSLLLVQAQNAPPSSGAPNNNPNATINDPTQTPPLSGGGNSTDGNVTADAPGRLTLLSPAITQVNKARFRIGDNVTISWKYDDNVQVKPANLTIAISTDRRTWINVTHLAGGATKYMWETGKWDELTNGPLMTSVQYYGVICDENGPNATPLAGHLMPNYDLQFQFYASGENFCAACGGAGLVEPNMWMRVVGMMCVFMVAAFMG